MPSSWKWKVWLLAALSVISVYLLVPTLFGFAAKKEAAETEGRALPWYFAVFPEKGINLGLDLRGGIYLEFEVEADKAVTNKVDSFVSDFERILKKDGVQFESVKQDVRTHTIVITGLSGDGADKVSSYAREYYDQMLVKVPTSAGASSITFGLTDKSLDDLRDKISRQALEKVRNRIDRYGVAEPTIQRLGSNRIAVELPGMKDPDRAIGLIKKAGQLEFKIVDETIADPDLKTMVAEARKEGSLPDDYTSRTIDRINELLRSKIPEDDEIAFETQYDPVAKKVVGGVPYLLHRKAEVTGEMLKSAQVNVNNNEPYVGLAFDAQGSTLFGETTTKNVNKKMAILLDGTVTKAPVIREPILGGQAQITLGYGNYSNLLKEAEDLTLVLQEGALPAQLTEATKTVVGPSLGADSIHKGVLATLIGAFIVCVFMVVYYKGSGAIADTALVLNFFFILAALSLLQATLTLPGIAGIALTLGMAVDANVLINERIREELRAGKSARAAVDAGYSNAMRAIIDSNVTTLIAGVVLYQFGTGPIKGFAITLIIGLTISMYTACICTRMVYDWLLIKRKITRISV
ncbi:MAG: protein translocase subunit SecD [Pseudomonadota bacterium]